MCKYLMCLFDVKCIADSGIIFFFHGGRRGPNAISRIGNLGAFFLCDYGFSLPGLIPIFCEYVIFNHFRSWRSTKF